MLPSDLWYWLCLDKHMACQCGLSVSADVFGKSLTLFKQHFSLKCRGGWEGVCVCLF